MRFKKKKKKKFLLSVKAFGLEVMEDRLALDRRSRVEQTVKLASLLDALDGAVVVEEDPSIMEDEGAGGEEVVVEDLEAAFRVGDLVFALFYVDGLWYKAKIEEELKSNSYVVLFTEYGNTQETKSSDIMFEAELAAHLAGAPSNASSVASTATAEVPVVEDPTARGLCTCTLFRFPKQ